MRIPSLDGLRALAIVLVLLAHVAGTRHAPSLGWLQAGDLGSLGVRVFFVVSGFLITLMLEHEFDRTGRISLSDFLRRRALRILPPFLCYVAAMAALTAAGVIALSDRDLLLAATFTMNYAGSRSWYVGHLWSLSVEAQFYVSWTILRVLAGRARMLGAALGVLAAAPATRVAMHLFAPGWRSTIGEALPTVVDALASGALLAILQQQLAAHAAYTRWLRSNAAGGGLVLAVIALNATMPHIAFSYTVGQTLINLLIALAVHRLVLFPERSVARLLNARAVAAFGAASYSVYLWQQPFLDRYSGSGLAAFPLNVVLALATAGVAYWVVERPALLVGRRLASARLRGAVHAHSIGLQPHVAAS